jgi:OFA family oxalate/formate antiporter-like MFS transporter
MLRTVHFYVLFAMALMMGIGGLMATAQVAPMADTLKISATVLTISLTLNPLANGGARIFWGWVSDHVGRERTMFVAFLLQALVLVGVVTLGRLSATWFVVTMALVFFTWGEVYSLFPSICADWFGARNVSSNYGFLYSAKGVASIVGGGLAAKLFEKTGSWDYGFYACAGFALITAIMALGLRKMPLPVKQPAKAQQAAVGDYAR